MSEAQWSGGRADLESRDKRRGRGCGRGQSWAVWWSLLAGMAGMAAGEGHAAAPTPEVTAVRVRYSAAELASPGAAQPLLQRLGNAALESCGASSFSLAEFKSAVRQSQCWKDAVDEAVRRIGSPALDSAVTAERRLASRTRHDTPR